MSRVVVVVVVDTSVSRWERRRVRGWIEKTAELRVVKKASIGNAVNIALLTAWLQVTSG